MAGCEDSETQCPGFSWDRDDFLYSIGHGAMFSLQEKNNIDNTTMFQLLLSSTAWSQEHFSFSASSTVLPARRWEEWEEDTRSWGDRTRTPNLNWPKGYSAPYDTKKPIKLRVVVQWGSCCSETGWASIGRWLAILLCLIHFVKYIHTYVIFTVISFSLFCLTKQHLSQHMCSIFFLFSLRSHSEVGSERKAACY